MTKATRQALTEVRDILIREGWGGEMSKPDTTGRRVQMHSFLGFTPCGNAAYRDETDALAEVLRAGGTIEIKLSGSEPEMTVGTAPDGRPVYRFTEPTA